MKKTLFQKILIVALLLTVSWTANAEKLTINKGSIIRYRLIVTLFFLSIASWLQAFNNTFYVKVGDTFSVQTTYHYNTTAVLWSYDWSVVEPVNTIYSATTSVTFRAIAPSPSNGIVIQAITYFGSGSREVDDWNVKVEGEGNEVQINETNFPDINFRNYLLSKSYGSDGKLTTDEISSITRMDDLWGKSIKSLKGIEYFTNLETLWIEENQISSLDLSKNIYLKSLNCESNQLSSLDVSKNTLLHDINCGGNQLTTLDVSKNTKL